MFVDEAIIRIYLSFVSCAASKLQEQLRQPESFRSRRIRARKSGDLMPFWSEKTHTRVNFDARNERIFSILWHDNYRPIRGAGVMQSVCSPKAASPAVSLLRRSRLSASRIGLLNVYYGACISFDTVGGQ